MSAPDDKPVAVAHVVQNLDVGGLERVVINLVNHTHTDRYTPVVVTLGDGGTMKHLAQCPVVSCHKSDGFAYTLPTRMAGTFRKYHVKIVHCHNFSPLIYGAAAGRLAGAAGILYTVHGAKTSSRRKQAWVYRLGLVDRVVTVSNDARRIAIEQAGLPERVVETIVNGVPLEEYVTAFDREAKRRELGIEGTRPVFGIVARLTPAKDHAMLFDAFAELVRRAPDALLLVVGDGELEYTLERRVDSLAMSESIRFLGRRDDIPDILRAIDVFVLSSHTEGLSVTLLEAMAASLPIVATRVGGNSEVVVHEETGLLVPPSDPALFADAMARLADDRELASAMGRAGRERAREVFSVEAMVDRYERIYDVLSGRGAR